MNKTMYKLQNMFKSKEQIEIESRMEFNKNKRSFEKYYKELDTSIKSFTKMARDAELSGNHANALSCVQFVKKLQKTQTKVQGLLQRFEMMNSMQRLSGVMTNFMQACTKMGINMDMNIDMKSMMRNTVEMEKALGKLDAMSEQMDAVFDSIDMGMTDSTGMADFETNGADAEAELDRIMGRYNDVMMPPSAVAQPAVAAPVAAAPVAAQPVAAAPVLDMSDDTDERLRKMMEDLKN